METPELTHETRTGYPEGYSDNFTEPSETFKCSQCGEYFPSEAICINYCFDCLEDSFSVDLGLEYLRRFNEEEGFLKEILEAEGNNMQRFRKEFINLLRKEFLNRVNEEEKLYTSLKNACLYEAGDWIRFIEGRQINKVNNYMKEGA